MGIEQQKLFACHTQQESELIRLYFSEKDQCQPVFLRFNSEFSRIYVV